ncbi:hydantoinase/oxoprolinase family protein [Desulfitobacterium sp.]|uniref:hydantoinase/oxoprolinase family protein n=1 Tax=Desulfitobacterium sp. TaxID=49981 RepID=UPI002B2025F7|nr:hydantoinase/oxoprolinase family protein [Desulfitobacterium sp.]MEA4903116.1 hydantoinase/oxoprolinase family protein [Desulfitobacterium sp.]
MLLKEIQVGIDVGGTFTDAVLLEDNRIVEKAKIATQAENVLGTVLHALDELKVYHKVVTRITVSTTLITNAILQQRLPQVDLLLFPGSGMSLKALKWPVPYQVLKGELDYRGREVSSPDELEWRRLLNRYQEFPGSKVAIVGKFSHRNSLHEENLAFYLQKHCPDLEICLGHEWGQANFYRRSLTTYLNLACEEVYQTFAHQLQQAVFQKGSSAKIHVLKADGGVVPLQTLRPVESIYSGPAASILGALAQTNTGPDFDSETDQSFVVVDIGGTTTDIGLILSGEPLMSAYGAKIGDFSTLVRTLAVRSIAAGGDSTILSEGDGFRIETYRRGPAYCLGGPAPTPTDAMCYLNLIPFGDRLKAEQGLVQLLPECKRDSFNLERLSNEILARFADNIAQAIESIIREWREEPAYKVWEVLHPHEEQNMFIEVSGGGAPGLVKALSMRLNSPVKIGDFPEVSNAIGAALARPTFSCTLHLDTFMKRYQIEETGLQGEWLGSRKPHKEIEEFLREIAEKSARDQGIELKKPKIQPFDYFPIVKGYQTVGQIIQGSLIVSPGVRGRLKS